jgi:GGDEF domain-containing protein
MADPPEPSFQVFNEAQFRHLLGREVQRAARYQDFLSLCLARTSYAGASSPSILAAVARRTAELLRSTDVIGLIDDVIAILLVHTADSDAAAIIERLRSRLEAETFQAFPGAPVVRPVLSLGLASFPTDASVEATLVAEAETRLAESERSDRRSSEAS